MKERRLTILFADLVGSTELSMDLESQDDFELKTRLRDLFEDYLDEYNGTFRKALGDGFMITFKDANQAVDYSIQVQRKIQSWRSKHSEHDPVFRFGLHTGQVTVDEDGDLYGADVNIAARIEERALPDEIYVSGSTRYELHGGKLDIMELGEQSLKGVDGEVLIAKVEYDKKHHQRSLPKTIIKWVTTSDYGLYVAGAVLFMLIGFGITFYQMSSGEEDSGMSEIKNLDEEEIQDPPYLQFSLRRLTNRGVRTPKRGLIITKVYNKGQEEMIELFNPTADTQYLLFLGEESPGLEYHVLLKDPLKFDIYGAFPIKVAPCSYFINVSGANRVNFGPDAGIDSSFGDVEGMRVASWAGGDTDVSVDAVAWSQKKSEWEIAPEYREGEPVYIEQGTTFYIRRRGETSPVDTNDNPSDFQAVDWNFEQEVPQFKKGYVENSCS